MSLAFDPDLPSGAFGAQRDAGQPLHRRRRDLGRPDHADRRPDGPGPERQELDHRRPDQLQLRLRGLGPAAGLHAPAGRTGAGGRQCRGAGRRGVALATAWSRRAERVQADCGAGGRSAAARPAAPAPVFFEGPTYFARTTNGGQSWEPAQEIYDPGPNAQTINNLIVVPPNGTVIDFFTDILPNGGTRIGLLRSFDKGATLRSGPSSPAAIATVFGIDHAGPAGAGARRLDPVRRRGRPAQRQPLPRLAGRPLPRRRRGRVLDVHGRRPTWSTPVRINKTPRNRNPLREQAFLPSIEVGAARRAGRHLLRLPQRPDDGREPTDYWAVFCDPATDCRQPRELGRRAAADQPLVRHAGRADRGRPLPRRLHGPGRRAATSSTRCSASPTGPGPDRPVHAPDQLRRSACRGGIGIGPVGLARPEPAGNVPRTGSAGRVRDLGRGDALQAHADAAHLDRVAVDRPRPADQALGRRGDRHGGQQQGGEDQSSTLSAAPQGAPETTIAQVLVAKYSEHLPLYRQAQVFARHGIELDRSTLSLWVGRACWWLEPLYERLLARILSSTKIFADDTPLPVLDPGRGRTKTGRLWAYAVDDRPWQGPAPPAVAYVYAEDRKGERPATHLAGFTGILQVDGYGGFKRLAGDGPSGPVRLGVLLVALSTLLLRLPPGDHVADRLRGPAADRPALCRRGADPGPPGRRAPRRTP